MKTTIEINGYQILVSEEEGKVMVSATKDDEVVEEFTLEAEGEDSGSEEDFGDDEMMPFDAEEEEDFGDDDEDSDEEDFGDDDEDESEEFESEEDDKEESKLESFRSFVRKRK